MSNPHLVELETWRDYIAEAPDFKIVVFSGHDFRIGLEDILKQGAVDIDNFDSPLKQDKDPLYHDKPLAKRGWQYYMLVNEQPLKGTVRTDEYAAGLVYKSVAGYEGNDCFNYVITNGYQQSTVGKIEIEVKPFYKLEIEAEHLGNGDYRFDANLIIPDGEPTPDLEEYFWTYAGPHEEKGRVVYGEFPSPFWQTGLRTIYSTSRALGFSVFTYRYRGITAYHTPPHDSTLEHLVDSTTGLNFVSKDELPEVILRARIYVAGYPMSREGQLIELETVFSEQAGSKWEKSGVVKDKEKDSLDTLAGIISPDFAIQSPDNTPHKDSLVPDVT